MASVLFRLISFAGPMHLLVRPLAVAAAVGLIVGIATGVLFRNESRASVIAAFLVLLAIEPNAAALPLGMLVLFYGANVVLKAVHRPQIPANTFIKASRFAASVLLALAIGGVWIGGVIELPTSAKVPARDANLSAGPDIYIVWLDAYARADTLLDTFGYDDGPFLDDLSARGFDVYGDATSNYNATLLTLVSMFNGNYVESLGLKPVASGPGQARILRAALAESAIPVLLRSLDYELIAIAPPISHAVFNASDRTIGGDEMTDLEVSLLASSGIGRLVIGLAPDFVLSQQRQYVEQGFQAAAELASSGAAGHPRFLLAHLMVPHPPFLYDHAGNAMPAPACFPLRCHLWEGEPDKIEIDQPDYPLRYIEQLRWVNNKAIQLLNQIIDRDPDAVVIVMGDHGSRMDSNDKGEQFRNLFAARTPGHPRLFGEQPTLVNVFPAVLNNYLRQNLPIQPSRHYFASDLGRLLEISPWP